MTTDILWPYVKILASLIMEDHLSVTINCKVLLTGDGAVRGEIGLVFILKSAILLNGSKTR